MEDGAATKIVTSQEIPKGWVGLDIGPATVRLFSEAIQDAKTIIWNGPMGMFERRLLARNLCHCALGRRRLCNDHRGRR